MSKKPIIGITIGDVAGVGPEVTAKVLAHKQAYEICKPLIIGDGKIMKKACEVTGVPLNIHSIQQPSEAKFEYGTLDVLDLDNIDMSRFEYGKVSAMSGKAAGDYIIKAVDLALAKQIDAIVTCPINKEALQAGGYKYDGHTEFLADLTHTKDYAMLLVNGTFRVAHVSTHCSLREACNRVKKPRVLTVIRLLHNTLRQLKIESPRIGVAGLNPHAGEHGLFGDEEIKEITPAIEEANKEGIQAVGPLPPDTIFTHLRGGAFDGVVAMYHDQGHIPSKVLGFVVDPKTGEWIDMKGVNVTIGLPIIRVSVEHGTAYDKAGKGIANPNSLWEAIQVAVELTGGTG
jgi:4-hydroxythreonine-4-phosphate dehydrogenase